MTLNNQRISSNRNQIYRAETNDRDIIIKLAQRENCAPLMREFKAIELLHAQGAPVPCPVPCLSDDDRVKLNGSEYIVRGFEFVQGNILIPSEETFFELGIAIGQLHNAWQTNEPPLWIPAATIDHLLYEPLQSVVYQYDEKELLVKTEGMVHEVASVLEDHWDKRLLGFTHGDAHHYNAIQTNRGKVILCDLEDLSWQWPVYDLATAIWGTFGRGGNAFIWDQLLVGYASVRPLSQEEAMLIRFLIFARHLWWLGLHAHHWDHWPQRYTRKQFFEAGIDLLLTIGRDVCALKI
jgi:Ser/Thr protein kinase RdoA (MazF antagonist)